MQRLNLPPVRDLVLPAMRHTRVSGVDDPNVLLLEFETTKEGHGPSFPGQPMQATICVPVTVVDAAGLLRSLLMLKQKGLIPHIPEAVSGSKPN
jgi:hypothetical protein